LVGENGLRRPVDVDRVIRELRLRVDRALALRSIETVRGSGYRLRATGGLARCSSIRVHATLITLGYPCPVTDPFGVAGRQLRSASTFRSPWRATVDASLLLMDDLEAQIGDDQ
jgi:hypothetical protein